MELWTLSQTAAGCLWCQVCSVLSEESDVWLCCRYRADTQTYQPYNKDWIKEKIYVLLRRQAQQAAK